MASRERAPQVGRVGTGESVDLGGLHALLDRADWFVKPTRPGRLTPGSTTKEPLTVPQRDAQAALREVVRLVADLPADSTPTVVWHADDSELLVDTAATTIACSPGVIRIGIAVKCDQVPRQTVVQVPFSVGTADAPTGLAMTTLSTVAGPPIIVSRWGDALTAFAWECVLELCRRLCERLGVDARGYPLVPGSIMADRAALLILPMGRNDLHVLTDLIR